MTGLSPPLAPKPEAVRRHAAIFVFITVFIDAIGIGIIIPVMPDLILELRGTTLSDAAFWGGFMAFVYAAMQFLFSPTLGNLSDRFGRRPVLLISLAMLVIDYLIMALAPSLFVLFIGRLLAGIAGATHSTANAYIADVTPKEKRAANFGLIGAGFGLGFVVGPVIGGLAGEIGTRVPFYAAAGIAGLNFLYGFLVLPESLPKERRRPFELLRANPFGAARQIARFPTLVWFFAVMLIFNLAQFVYPATWSYFTREAFDWSAAEVGISLALVGIGFAITQGWLIRIILPRFGEVKTAIIGLIANILALGGLAFATESWMVYALMPVSALGAIVTPAVTGLMANAADDNAQGELQGALSSVAGITLILSPLLMTQLFGHFTGPDAPVYFPGAPYLCAAVLMVLALIILRLGMRRIIDPT